jgi:hypothetical protein
MEDKEKITIQRRFGGSLSLLEPIFGLRVSFFVFHASIFFYKSVQRFSDSASPDHGIDIPLFYRHYGFAGECTTDNGSCGFFSYCKRGHFFYTSMHAYTYRRPYSASKVLRAERQIDYDSMIIPTPSAF